MIQKKVTDFFALEGNYPDLDGEGAAARLSAAIRCKTINYFDHSQTDYTEFDKLHAHIKASYPNIMRVGTFERIGHHAVLITIPGSDASLRPCLYMSHQDVVPVVEGTEQDWTHPAFSGDIADGYIWGRGTLDTKVTFNGVLSAANYLIGQGFQPVSSFNYGAKKYSRVKKAFWFTLCASLVTMAVFAGVVYVFRRELLLQFLTDMDAYEIAFYALQIQCLTLPFIPVCICGNMLFQSIGKGGRATILASFRSGTIYIPALLILTAFFGLRGIQWSQPVSDILSAVLSLPVAVAFLKGLPEDGVEV